MSKHLEEAHIINTISRLGFHAQRLTQTAVHRPPVSSSVRMISGINSETVQRMANTAKSIGFAALQLPLTIANGLTHAHYAVKGMNGYLKSIDAKQSDCEKHFILYRAITDDELKRVLTHPNGPLFNLPQSSTQPNGLDTFLHISGTTGYDHTRALTSFSACASSAYKFAYSDPAYGVVATFKIPKELMTDSAKPGSVVYHEVLLPTSHLTLDMIASLEVRSGKELEDAKDREIISAANDSYSIYQYKFDTPPVGTCIISDPDQRAHTQALLEELKDTFQKNEAEAARIEASKPPTITQQILFGGWAAVPFIPLSDFR